MTKKTKEVETIEKPTKGQVKPTKSVVNDANVKPVKPATSPVNEKHDTPKHDTPPANKKEKVNPEDLPVEQKLTNLYKLQTTLSEIDKIKTLRGELPLEVQDLEDEVAGLQTRIQNFSLDIKEIDTAVGQQRIKITDSNGLINKYKTQLDNVRNNREFDNLSKEIEFQGLEVELAEKRIREFTAESKMINEEIVKSKKALEERQSDLRSKKEELNGIISETKIQEEQLREKAKQLETTIEARLLAAFKRIRKSARNGLAVVYIQRDACGGCFNKIPPQRQLDIKLRKKTIVCEHCGRIMIDPQLAGVE